MVSVEIGPTASAVSGLSVTTSRSLDSGSEGFKWAQAVCPPDTNVLGGGADVSGGANSVHVSSMLPLAGFPDSFYATAMEDPRGYSGAWTLSAWAVCGSGVTGWQIVQADVPAEPDSTYAAAVATCPAGKKVIGVGGAVSGGSRYVLDSVDPGEDLTDAFVEVLGDETTPIAGSAWGAHAYAVCIDPVAGQQLVTATTGWSPANKTTSVSMPERDEGAQRRRWPAGRARPGTSRPSGPAHRRRRGRCPAGHHRRQRRVARLRLRDLRKLTGRAASTRSSSASGNAPWTASATSCCRCPLVV